VQNRDVRETRPLRAALLLVGATPVATLFRETPRRDWRRSYEEPKNPRTPKNTLRYETGKSPSN